jgi:hypothetical protein
VVTIYNVVYGSLFGLASLLKQTSMKVLNSAFGEHFFVSIDYDPDAKELSFYAVR